MSIGRLKPAFTLDPILPATPPRQGRLPNVIPAVNPPVISPPSADLPVLSPPPVADSGQKTLRSGPLYFLSKVEGSTEEDDYYYSFL